MLKEDLSTYVHSLTGQEIAGMLSVGWISRGEAYPLGGNRISNETMEKLRFLLADKSNFRANIIRGQEPCPVCSELYSRTGLTLGCSELWIPHKKKIYVSPDLIFHYIEDHDYMPPQEYIEAVVALDPCQPFKAEEINEKLVFG